MVRSTSTTLGAQRQKGKDPVTSHDTGGSLDRRVTVASDSRGPATFEGDSFFAAAFAYAAVPIAIADPQGRYVRVNPAFEELVGYTEDEVREHTFMTLSHPDDREEKSRLVEQLLSGAIPAFVMEKRYIRKSGEPVWVLNSVSLVRDESGQPKMFIAMAQDITERKLADRERGLLLGREREARSRAEAAERTLQAIIQHVPAGIIVVDAEGQVIIINDTGRRISGVVPEGDRPVADQAATYRIRDPVTRQDIAPEDTPIARAVAGESVSDFEYAFIRPNDGAESVVRVDAVPLRSEDGNVIGAVATFMDVTRQQVAQSQQRDFAFAAAHDLKNPLTSIKGFTQLMQRRLARKGVLTAEDSRRDLERIDATVVRMSALIGELLDTARLEMGESLDLHREPADLVELARNAVEHVEEVSTPGQIRLETACDRIQGRWDPSRLERALTNLLTNAVKYSPDESPVTVSITVEDGTAVIVVADRGIGVPAGDLPYIFERFYRGSNVPRESTGTGVGLAGVRQIVEQHDGTIKVESVEGEGSTFTIHLPAE
jgi:PAS domain S-box-containing protein